MKKNTIKMMVIALVTTLLATGCGDTSSKDNSEESSPGQEVEQGSGKNEDNNSNETTYPLTIDAYGVEGEKYTQTITEPPSKVITNNPSSTDLLLELGLGDRIIGILKPDNKPDEKWASAYNDFKILGDKKSMSKEVIIGSEPDFIFGRVMPFKEDSMGTVKDFNDMGINVYTQIASNFAIDQSLENVILDIKNIGKIFNVSEKTNSYADSLQLRLDKVKSKVSNLPKDQTTKVLFMVTYVDGTFNTFGANTAFQSEMLKTIKAENVLETGTNSLTSENLITLNPDVIIYITSDRNAKTDPLAVKSLLSDTTIESVPAIKNKKILEIEYDEIMDYGIKNFDTLEKLYEYIY